MMETDIDVDTKTYNVSYLGGYLTWRNYSLLSLKWLLSEARLRSVLCNGVISFTENDFYFQTSNELSTAKGGATSDGKTVLSAYSNPFSMDDIFETLDSHILPLVTCDSSPVYVEFIDVQEVILSTELDPNYIGILVWNNSNLPLLCHVFLVNDTTFVSNILNLHECTVHTILWQLIIYSED